MAIVLVLLLIGLAPTLSYAQSYSAGGNPDCVDLPAYQGDGSAEYVPNQTADGWAAAPADIAPSPFGENAFDTMQIGLDIPMDPFVPNLRGEGLENRDDPRLDFRESGIGLGVLEVEKSGTIRFNGNEVKSQPYTAGPACE